MVLLRKLLGLFLVFWIRLSPVAATARQLDNSVPPAITVTGIVFCDKCFQGSLSNELTTALPGAQVELECSAEKLAQVVAVTDKNGVFRLNISSGYYKRHGGDKCLVTLLSSPNPSCKIPTDIGSGLTGARLSERAGSGINELIYSVGPFAFRPATSTCSSGELPSPPTSAAAETTYLHDGSTMPPLPPAIFPVPYPRHDNAPPISSSPFLSFNPPPSAEVPAPEAGQYPPPDAIVIPPRPPSPPVAPAPGITSPPPAPLHFPPPSISPPPVIKHSPPPAPSISPSPVIKHSPPPAPLHFPPPSISPSPVIKHYPPPPHVTHFAPPPHSAPRASKHPPPPHGISKKPSPPPPKHSKQYPPPPPLSKGKPHLPSPPHPALAPAPVPRHAAPLPPAPQYPKSPPPGYCPTP